MKIHEIDPLLLEVPVPIQTPRLIIRPPQKGDGAALSEAKEASWPELQSWMPWAQDKERHGAELLFEVFSQRYERGSTLVTSNLPFDEWTSVFGSERLTGALLDRLTHHVHILEMNGDSFRLKQSTKSKQA